MAGDGSKTAEVGGDEVELSFPDANIAAIEGIAGVFSSILGPTSRDKLIIEALATRTPTGPVQGPAVDEYAVTSDGATVLETLPLEHPIAPVLRRIPGPETPGDTDVEGAHIPDGVSSTVVLTGALLSEAESLLDRGLHPYTVRTGYNAGLEVALETLESETDPVDRDDRARTHAIAKTAMTGNDVAGLRDVWARIAVEAVDQVGEPDERTFAVRTIRNGSIAESRLVRGSVLPRNRIAHDDMPRRLEDPSILVLGGFEAQGGLQDPEIRGDISIDSIEPEDVPGFEALFADRRHRMVEKLERAGVDVVIARTGIDTEFKRLLADRGIMGIRSVNALAIDQIAAATGATVVKHPDDIDAAYLGTCGVIEEQRIDRRMQRRKRRRMVVIDDCPDPGSVTALLRGVSGQTADQAERQLRKGAAAVAAATGATDARGGVVPGGGAIDAEIADRARDHAPTHGSRVQLGVEAFADAAESLLGTLAKNAGQVPYDVVADVRARRTGEDVPIGIALPDGTVTDTADAGILDPVADRIRCYTTAVEVANLVLNIDDALDAVEKQQRPDPDDAHYEDAAEQQRRYQKEHDITP